MKPELFGNHTNTLLLIVVLVAKSSASFKAAVLKGLLTICTTHTNTESVILFGMALFRLKCSLWHVFAFLLLSYLFTAVI